jgi:Peptidase family M23
VTTVGYLAGGAAAILTGVAATFDRRFDAKRWFARAVDPIVLQRPFRETWKVAAGGADPQHNHHQAVSDQLFAYDFLCEEGTSWDREILAPCDGTVAWTVDDMEDAAPDAQRRDTKNPAGNYVSIETPRGYVILAHLKKRSVAILPGTPVRTGDVIGRCGNSGNTSSAHLHIHAQNRAQMAVDVAEGIPIAFLDRDGQAMILEYGDLLGPSTKL